MIITTRFTQPCSATDAANGDVFQIPAGFGGLFIIHRDTPIMFYYVGPLCLATREAFCAATGTTQESMENLESFDDDDDGVDCDDDASDDAVH